MAAPVGVTSSTSIPDEYTAAFCKSSSVPVAGTGKVPTVLLSMLVWRRHSGPRFRGHILYGLRQREIVLPQRNRLMVMRMMMVMPVGVLMLVGALFPVHFAWQFLFAVNIDIHLGRGNPTAHDAGNFQSCADV